jgi:hypothetical protein
MAIFCYETAIKFVKEKIDTLDEGPRAWHNRGIKRTAYKIGIEEVLDEICSFDSKIYKNFAKTNRYTLSDDDIRIVVADMKGKIIQDQEKHSIPSWL